MSQRVIEFQRNTLYEQAWSHPQTKLALQYGVTPLQLKQAAQALAVPLPPSGHWTKVARGDTVKTTPLPDFDGETTYRLTKWVDEEAEEVARRFETARDGLELRAPALPEMREALADCLPIVKQMAARLKKGSKDGRDWPAIKGMGQFELAVAPANQERALLTMDRVIRHCQAAGFKLVSDEAQREPATFVVNGVAYTLRIFESGRREERELTAREKAERKAYPDRYHYTPDRWTFHPSNLLRLEVHNPGYRSAELTIQDGSDAPLADRIGDLPLKLQERALKEKLRQDVGAEERKREEARREAHARRFQAKRDELERLKHFEEAADQAERASRLRSLAAAMEASGRYADAEGQEKVVWIRNAADWLDPTLNKHWPVVDDVEDRYY